MPHTVPYKKVKAAANATQARLRGEQANDGKSLPAQSPFSNGNKAIVADDDPSQQLRLEMRQAAGSSRDGDVDMTG